MRTLVVAGLAAVALAVRLADAPAHWQAGRHNAEHAICSVFGPYCAEALVVAGCETGGTYSVWARNGQFLGLFQMGSGERRRWGHGADPWSQARAARRYFEYTNRSWQPWPECRWRVPRIGGRA